MFANIPNGHRARDVRDSANSSPLSDIADARHVAFMLAIGESRQTADPPVRQRPHRGMLPDVDMGNVVHDPNRRPLFGRIVALIGRLAGRPVAVRAAAGTMSGDSR